jgi:hypothetical protein
MLGYTEEDVVEMFEAVLKAETLINDNTIKSQLCKTSEFLEGLLVEGRI